MTRRDAGFTLLEVLVALLIFGILMTGLVQGAQLGVHAWGVQNRTIAAEQDLAIVDQTVRRLIATMDPGNSAYGPPHFIGNRRSMAFTAALPAAVDAYGAPQAEVILTADAAHRLVLRWAPHFADPLAPVPPHVSVLLTGIDHLELAYWNPAPAPGHWVDQWADKTLPRLVRLRVVFPPDDPRRWPPILAAVESRP